MTLSKRDDVWRQFRSFRRHLFLIAQPFLAAAFITALWTMFWQAGVHLPKEDEVVLTAVVAMLSVTFGILAGVVLSTIWEKYQKVVVCVLKHDVNTFLIYRDERIPIVFHLLLGSLSVPIILVMMLFEYKSYSSGLIAVFSVTFAISIYWLVGAELQNPAKSLWFAERIPEAWLDLDIDEHFKMEEALKKK